MKSSTNQLRRDAMAIFRAGLTAAAARNAVRRYVSIARNSLKAGDVRLRLKDFNRVFLIAAGKASVEMAAALEEILRHHLIAGIAVAKHPHAASTLRCTQVVEAGHPIPNVAGFKASLQIRNLLRELNARDLLLVAVSGGASALLGAPAEPVTLRHKQRTTELLLRAGATIQELNAVRKHLSMLKGGRFAALAYPATVVGLLLSDVIGDPPDVIGSGLTAPDPSTFADAIAVLAKFDLLHRVPRSVRVRLEAGARGEIPETPKPGNQLFDRVHNVLIGSNRLALEAAAREADVRGYRPLILSATMQGETREVACVHAEILREVVVSGNPVIPPACILSGGETTVTVHGDGKGGRNQEFALALAIALAGVPRVLVLSAGTDGTDGPTDAAGAIATGQTLERAHRLGLDAAEHLLRNDAYPFFEKLGDLVKTGPTGTNVMDLHILLAGR